MEFEITGFYIFTDNEFTGELEQESIFLETYEEAKRFTESSHLKNKNRVEILARVVTK